jgi:hypothetical protein
MRRVDQDFTKTGKHFMLAAVPNRTFIDTEGNCVMTPRGIASSCDWAVLIPCFYGNLDQPPKSVFVHHLMLPHFVENILPNIPASWKFVLVSSGTDQTIPTGRGDVRFKPIRGFADADDGGPNWQLLTTHPQILHWFCGNHDLTHPRVSTLPVGIVEGVEGMQHVNISTPPVPLQRRPIQFFVAHRVRSGIGQWETRVNVTLMCRRQQRVHTPQHAMCVTPPSFLQRDRRKGISQATYVKIAQYLSFVVCVNGGGLDPSPKAWEAIMLGTIPIIQHSTLDDAYSQLPVAFVGHWSTLFGSISDVRARLMHIRTQLSPFYTDPAMRAKVLEVRSALLRVFLYHGLALPSSC